MTADFSFLEDNESVLDGDILKAENVQSEHEETSVPLEQRRTQEAGSGSAAGSIQPSHNFVYHESFPRGRVTQSQVLPWEKCITLLNHDTKDKKIQVSSSMADSRVHIISSYDVDLNDLMKNLWLWEVKFEIFFVEEEAEWLDVFSRKKDQSLFHLLPLIFQADFVWWKVKNYNMLAHSFHLNQERVRVGMKDCMSEKVNVGRDSGAEDPGVNLENVLDDVLNPFRRLKVGYSMLSSEKVSN